MAKGPPSTLTPEVQDRICAAVETTACTIVQAAEASGIHRMILWRWRRRGEDDIAAGRETNESRFCDALRAARARGLLRLLEEARSDSKGGARALNIYERRMQEDGEVEPIEANDAGQGAGAAAGGDGGARVDDRESAEVVRFVAEHSRRLRVAP